MKEREREEKVEEKEGREEKGVSGKVVVGGRCKWEEGRRRRKI